MSCLSVARGRIALWRLLAIGGDCAGAAPIDALALHDGHDRILSQLQGGDGLQLVGSHAGLDLLDQRIDLGLVSRVVGLCHGSRGTAGLSLGGVTRTHTGA